MSWSFWLILLPTLCYSLAAVVYGMQRNWPLVIVYTGYAWANCGLLWLDKIMSQR